MVLSKIGLTGAIGMLGRHIRNTLEEEGIHVISTTKSSDIYDADEVYKWDLGEWLSADKLDLLFDGVQAVIHAGAMIPHDVNNINESIMYDVNVRSCMNLGNWASEKNIPIVYVSGAIVYRYQDNEFQNESSELGWNDLGGFYGFSKLLGESVLNSLCSKGLKLSVVRPSSIYGFGLPSEKMISSFLMIASEGGAIELTPPVDDKIDFIHALDVSAAILKILKTETWEYFNISSGAPLSVKEVAEACVEVVKNGSVIVKDSKLLLRKPVNRFSIDSSKARDALNWKPALSIKQGLNMIMNEAVSKTNYIG